MKSLRCLWKGMFIASVGGLMGFGVPVHAQPKVEPPKNPLELRKLPGLIDRDLLERAMPPGLPKQQLELLLKQIEQMEAQLQRELDLLERLPGMGANGGLNPFLPIIPNADLQRLPPNFPQLPPNLFPNQRALRNPVEGKGRLGVRVKAPDEETIATFGLVDGKGLLIEAVYEDSVAAKAGLKEKDILLQFNGKEVSSDGPAFTNLVSAIPGGTKIDIVVLRDGMEETIKGVVLPDAPRSFPGRLGGLRIQRGFQVPFPRND